MIIMSIEAIKQQNCLLLMILHDYWSDAVFGKQLLDPAKIVHLTQKIKEATQHILRMCQSQPNYIPWQVVPSRKRLRVNDSYEPESKRSRH